MIFYKYSIFLVCNKILLYSLQIYFMWIRQEYIINDRILYVVAELEPNEGIIFAHEYLKRHYPESEIRLVSPTDSGYIYHKIEDLFPHKNVVNVIGKRERPIRKNYLFKV